MNKRFCTIRENAGRSAAVFERGGSARVAFLGGSITEANGWRTQVTEWLKGKFPRTAIDFINAGISSTDSTLGSHRLGRDVLQKGQVDLLFVEFAVNERVNRRQEQETRRGMEGIIRQALRHNPQIEIILLYTVDPEKMADIRNGGIPAEIVTMERIAHYYQISSIDLAREVTVRIDTGEFDWGTFGGLHPAPFGHTLYAETIQRMLERCWSLAEGAAATYFPEQPLDSYCYENGHFGGIDEAKLSGFNRVEAWWPAEGQTRKHFVDVPVLEGNQAGDSLTYAFSGSSIGILVTAGFDAGSIRYQVDDREEREVDLFTIWSKQLHIPWAHMLEAELDDGPHELKLSVSAQAHRESQGHAVRVHQFLINR